jgi:translation initiation factor 1
MPMAKKPPFSTGAPSENPFAAALSQALGGYTPDSNAAADAPQDSAPEVQPHGWVHIGFEKKGRAGKTVTLLEFVDLDEEGAEEAVEKWAKKLKTTCGVGGTVEAFSVLLQGDVRSKAEAELRAWGFKTKRIGG